MNTQNYAVNIRVGLANPARVNISQGDTGRTLAFSLYDGLSPFTPPTGSTVTIVGRKPSKLGFSETCTVSGSVATVATTLAMTQEAGKFPAELRIEAGGQSIGTANFTMYVEPSPHPDGTTDGTHATVDNLQTQIGNLANLTTTAKTNLVSAINEAAQSGGVVIDDTLTQTGAAADSKKTGDEIASLKADLAENIENYKIDITWISGYVTSAGVITQSSTTRQRSDKIPCLPGDIITYVAETNHSSVSAIAFFNENNIFISGVTNIETKITEHEITAPDASVYFIISALNGMVTNHTAMAKINISNGRKILIEAVNKTKDASVGYVDSANGNDNNSGLSRSTPLATIQKAIDLGFSVILVREGQYAPIDLTNRHNVFIGINHYYDSYTAGSDEDNPKIIIDGGLNTNVGIRIVQASNITLEGIEIRNCVQYGIYAAKNSNLKIVDCVAHDIYNADMDSAAYGFRIDFTDANLYNCTAYNIGTNTTGAGRFHADGFNFHSTGTTNLYNCNAYNCEDDGVSHHDACNGLIDGGEWHHCGKGGVASPTHGAKIDVRNIYSHDNAYGIYVDNQNAVTQRPNILFSNCVLKNNATFDFMSNAYYNVVLANCIYDTINAPNAQIFTV